jgi:hypothetical protein
MQSAEGVSIMPIITGTPSDGEPERTLSKEEIQRYSRHLIMPEVGMEGSSSWPRPRC